MDSLLETNHVALLHHRAKTSGNTILFKFPVLRGAEPPLQWNDMSVSEFAAEVEKAASFLAAELSARDIPPHSIVSLLFTGSRFQDLVHAIALARASFVPQMLPHILTHPEVIFSLMEKVGSRLLMYDSSLENQTAGCPYPKMVLNPAGNVLETVHNAISLPRVEDLSSGGSDLCFVYLTSGSTSGSPKVVPLTQKFVSVYYKTQFGIWIDGKSFDSQNAFLSRGSICAIAPIIQYLGCLYTRSCIVQPSKMRYSTEELSNMVKICGLNRMTTFGTWLAPHIQAAKIDPAALKLLQGMRTVSYGGVPISMADDDWCFQNGIPIMDMYATTECGLLMSTAPGRPGRFMQPVPGLSYRFDPVNTTLEADEPTSTQIFTFVVLADSPQIPKSHLLSADGNFHTSDLFEKQSDGSYLFRGRNDDWIKSEDARLIDSKAIEEKIYEVCGNLIKDCVVVGHMRPSPALFIEVQHEAFSTISEDYLKETLLQRIKDFNAHQCVHERITDKRLIFIVEEGTLPRTNKGNFRRKAIEEKYITELNAVYKLLYNL